MNQTTTPLGTSVALSVVKIDEWATRNRAAQMLCCSIAQIRKWEKKGRLHPVTDANGVWRFQPNELEELADELGLTDDERTRNDRDNAYARVDLANSIKLLRSVTQPQEAQHNRWLQMFDRQDAENKWLRERVMQLETELRTAYRAQQDAEDRTHERKTVEGILQEREKRTTEVWTKIVEHGAKFLNGGGTPFLESLTEEQMAMLFGVMGDFTQPQQEVIRASATKLGFDVDKLSSLNDVRTPTQPAPPPEPYPEATSP